MSPAVRLALWYGVAVATVSLIPYLAVLLSDAGVDDHLVPAALALIPLGNLVGAIPWSWAADRMAAPRRVLLVSTALAAAAGIGLLVTHSGVGMALILLGYALARAPQGPIADALAVRVLGRDGYGAVRLWGSVGFLVTAAASGVLREWWPRAPLLLVAVLLVGTVVVTTWLPEPADVRARPARPPLRALVRRPVLLVFAAVAVLHGIGITTYDNLFSLHIERVGLPSRVIGASIAVGVGAEIVVMALARRLLGRLSPSALMVAGVASGIPRWWLTGILVDPVAQIATQALHGLGFGAFWVGAVALLAKNAPEGLENSTQALLPATMFGAGYLLSMGAATVVLRGWTTSDLFVANAAVSIVATALALAVWRLDRR